MMILHLVTPRRYEMFIVFWGATAVFHFEPIYLLQEHRQSQK